MAGAQNVSRICFLVLMLALSLQLGQRFQEGRRPAGDICTPNGTFVSRHRANGDVRARWAEREGCCTEDSEHGLTPEAVPGAWCGPGG